MPKSSANVPESQPSIDRLQFTSESVRSGSDAAGNWTPGTNCMYNCFEESV